jgi:hypothetical protein
MHKILKGRLLSVMRGAGIKALGTASGTVPGTVPKVVWKVCSSASVIVTAGVKWAWSCMPVTEGIQRPAFTANLP